MFAHSLAVKLTTFCTLMSILVWTVACGDDDNPDTTEPEGESETSLTVAVAGEPPNFDITAFFATGLGFNVLLGTYEGLTGLSADGEAIGALSDSWVRDSETVWRFHLREGVTFHNGDAFDTAVAVSAFERILDESVGSEVAELYLGSVASVAADGADFLITTNGPDPALPVKLAYVFIPAPALLSDTDRLSAEIIGTGPYQVTEIERGLRWQLARFDEYWGTPGRYDEVTYLVREDDNARTAVLASGEADIALALPAAVIDSLPDYTIGAPVLNVSYHFTTNGNEWSAQTEFRQAVAYATDIDEVLAFYDPLGIDARGQYAPATFLGSNDELESYPHDPSETARLLESIGYAGEEITVGVYPERHPRADLLGELVVQQFQEAGINARILVRSLEDVSPDFVRDLGDPATKPAIILQAGGDFDFPDPSYYYDWFACDTAVGRICDEQIQALIEQDRLAETADARVPILQDLWERARELLPVYGIVNLGILVGHQDDVTVSSYPDAYFRPDLAVKP